ncbi:Phosphoserine phosphatase RsbU [Mucisphaera calidilacus]|uniref:Phosphoserine phosphatase RsbU n=2 Tax=Mucisphaera calidilacus TaxID=2527982 RepID=A0A518BUY2_9BACT|nr:Phosphoserine phosphatase RsbU [Mucisphaera calidilacus]
MPDQPGSLRASPLWQVLKVTRQLLLPIDLDTVLRQVIDVACAVHDADRASVFLYDASTRELYARVAKGADEIRFSIEHGIAGHALREREIVNVPDCYSDERFNKDVDKATSYRTNNLLTVPLIGDGDVPVGVLQVLNKRGGPFGVVDEELADVLSTQCAAAVQRAMLIEDRLMRQKLERDLDIASDIQRRTMPEEVPQIAGYEILGWSLPAEQTGGDAYDVAELQGGRMALLLGDATGHGIGPALSVTQVRSMLRLSLRLDAPLDRLVEQINAQVMEDLPAERFVTAFFGVLDAGRHEVAYHAPGQAPILHYKASEDAFERFDATTFPLGILEEIELEARSSIALAPGDVLAVISDGVFEYQNETGRQFGTDRTENAIRKGHADGCPGMLAAIREDVSAYADGAVQNDDMTVLLVRRRADGELESES